MPTSAAHAPICTPTSALAGALILGSLITAGCGPSLDMVQTDRIVLTSTHRCAQGPFEIRLAALGSRWGESVRARLDSDHAVFAHYRLEVAGTRRAQGEIRTSKLVPDTTSRTAGAKRWQRDAAPDNPRCIERPAPIVVAEIVTVAPPAPPQVLAPPAAPPTGQPVLEPPPPPRLQQPQPPSAPRWPQRPGYALPPPPPPPPLPPPPPPPPPPSGPPSLVAAAAGTHAATHEHRFLRWWHSDTRLEHAVVIPRAATIVLHIWADEPQDWAGVRIIVTQLRAQPDVPEGEWVAHLRQKAEEEARQRRERRLEWAKGAADRAVARKKAQRERAIRVAHCRAHHEDEGCWGAGGYDASIKRLLAARARRKQPPPAQRPRKDMPLPPIAEDGGPPPSPDSRWVGGFWRWYELHWVWLGGWWKVPERDFERRVTLVAPTAPPPLRVEVCGAVPFPHAVWLAGHWVWRVDTWIWLAGRWSMPPTAGMRWRRPKWVRGADGVTVRLAPGRWLLRAARKALR